VDGDAVVIAPKVPGYVVTLAIRDNQQVKAGDLLVRIDPRDYLAARDQAQAALATAQAQLGNAQVNLAMTKVSAPAKLVQAKAQVDEAVANRMHVHVYQRAVGRDQPGAAAPAAGAKYAESDD
jgi:membrane fusion protein (multidrug efflux system)